MRNDRVRVLWNFQIQSGKQVIVKQKDVVVVEKDIFYRNPLVRVFHKPSQWCHPLEGRGDGVRQPGSCRAGAFVQRTFLPGSEW